ncbi:hypothetical protein [Microbacterium telephonicum]|uniref:BNR repeat protein n=1 Tax=Microbacterium telephonicum TaxID=1714841 RepID=A0A498C5U2_9MICO|nr:hypothetical protein [Microbacterium telephonicum]RLK47968.1 hypothetical protein C7474_2567 [Microbacterium telephonicum]
MRGGFSTGTGRSRIAAIVAVVVLAAIVGVLAVFALQSTRGGAPAGETMSPAPTFTFGDRTSPNASPTQTSAPATAAADERFLAIEGDTMWRATAGQCGGAAPVVEMSTDAGSTWRNLTPADARQVLGLSTFDGNGEVIAATGDTCEPTALRTYTAGVAWESYPDVLAGSTYASPADPASIIVSGSPVAAPCAEPRSVRTSRGVVGTVCNNTAYAYLDNTWSELTTDAIALDAVSGAVVVAHTSPDCLTGVTVTRYTGTEPTPEGCIPDAAPTTPAALSVLGPDTVLWTADALLRPTP